MASPKPVSKPLKDSGGHVRVKPAAKPIPNPPNEAKAFYKFDSSRGRAYNRASKEYEAGAGRHGNMYEQQDAAREAAINAQTTRKANIAGKKLVETERNKASFPRTTPGTAWSNKKAVKIDSGNKLNKSIPAAKKANAKALKAANKPGPLRVRTSGLQGRSGALGGQHMGGHGFGGAGLNLGDVNK